MAGDSIGFFRKDGRIIPIRSSSGAGRHAGKALRHARIVKRAVRAVAVGSHLHHAFKHGLGKPIPGVNKIKVNRALDITGLGLSVASGLVGNVMGGGWKATVGAAVASEVLDAGSIAANVSSVVGRGHMKARAKQGAKQEARNVAVGNAIWLGGLAMQKSKRDTAIKFAGKAVKVARKALGFIE